MAGEWIKMRTSLLTNPKVNGIARILEESRAVSRALSTGFNGPMSEIVTRDVMRYVTVSLLLTVWGNANELTRNGVFKNAVTGDIDDMVGIPGFADAMADVGWLIADSEARTVTLPNFNEYNTSGEMRGASARTAADRQRAYRERKKLRLDGDATRDITRDVTRNRREENRRIEQALSPAPSREGERGTKSALHLDAERAAAAMQSAGLSSIKASRPELSAWLSKGVTVEQLADAAREAVVRNAHSPVAYAFKVLADRVASAAEVAAGVALPAVAWDSSRSSIEAKGEALGLGRWDRDAFDVGSGEPFAAYHARVRAAVDACGPTA